jgi:hypothetical protein
LADVIDRLIAAIAGRQHGNITRHQLLEAGLSSSGIAHRIRIGMLHPVFRSVYAVGTAPRSPLQRAAAAVLACGSRAALDASSAMTLWGFWKRWETPFEVVVLEGDRRPQGIRVHRPRNIARRDITTQLGVRVTTPARTIFSIAPRLNDRQLKRDVNNALHSKYLTKSALVDLLERHPHHPVAKRLRYFVTTEDGPTLSDWEREFPEFCEQFGLPRPVLGVPSTGHIIDAAWPGVEVLLELDSWEYHNTRVDFETDRDRDADAVAAGLPTVRITWERMKCRPEREAERLYRIVDRWRRRAA